MPNGTAVRANGAFRPEDAFEHCPGVVIVLEVRCSENRLFGHDHRPLMVKIYQLNLVVSTG
jgi:hypothetical protein